MVVKCPYCDAYNRVVHTRPMYICAACELSVANPAATGDMIHEKQEKAIFWIIFVIVVLFLIGILA